MEQNIEEYLFFKFKNNVLITNIDFNKNTSSIKIEFQQNNLINNELDTFKNKTIVIITFHNVRNFENFSFETENPFEFPKILIAIDEHPNKTVVVTSNIEYLIEAKSYEIITN